MQKINLNTKDKQKLKSLLLKYQNAGKTYSDFSANRDDAYEYTRTINLRACPYCNINHTYTVYNNPKHNADPLLRPDIDHFEPQCEKTDLTLQQNNLIPSCQQCNSRIKLRKVFSATTHIHPYIDDFHSIMKFSIRLNLTDYLSRNNFDILLVSRDNSDDSDIRRAQSSIKDLGLLQRYQHHKDDVIDLFYKAQYYHRSRIEEIEDLLNAQNLQYALFSHRTDDINSKPLSKLTNDILDLIL